MTISPTDLIQRLSWRYAVKKFDPSRKIDAQTWAAIEQAMILSPSSMGLQPWRFVVVTTSTAREALRSASFNQPQITDASHLVVFARRDTVTPADVETHLRRVAETRKVSMDALAEYRKMAVGSISDAASLPGGSMESWTRSQVYIALGFFLCTCAVLGVDACPMEGFDPEQYDRILDLPAQGYRAVVLGAAGYRSADDRYANLAKVRHAHAHVIQHV